MKFKTLLFTSLFILSILALNFSSTAQSSANIKQLSNDYNTWYLSLNYGLSDYQGYIKAYPFWPTRNKINARRFAEGFSVNKQLTYRLGIQGDFVMGKLAGALRIDKNNFINNTDFFNGNY